MPTGDRLSDATLAQVRPAAAPPYDRRAPSTIVHVGVGAFARAHLAVYADELLRLGVPALIRGVSLRSGGAEEQLAPQDGLFTVLEREPDRTPDARVIGSLASVGTGWEDAVAAISAPTTSMVTATVTEKGYELATGDLDPEVPPSSAPAVIARGLLARPEGPAPPVVASLDNLLDNGAVLRERVRQVVAAVSPDHLGWLDRSVAFPSSVVDRIVPATTGEDIDEVAAQLGLVDPAAVVAEHHRSWVIEDVPGLPPLGKVGVTVVADTEPWQRRKLWLLNGPHSAVACAGLVAGIDTIASAAADPVVAWFADRYVADVCAVADLPDELAARSFALDALRRFRNPALGHRCAQVGSDGSRKLPQRVLPVLARLTDRHLPTTRATMVLAMWLVAVADLPVQGRHLDAVDDPRGDELRALAPDPVRLCAAALPDQPEAVQVEVLGAAEAICRRGIRALEDVS